jgi:hypothetical protein
MIHAHNPIALKGFEKPGNAINLILTPQMDCCVEKKTESDEIVSTLKSLQL